MYETLPSETVMVDQIRVLALSGSYGIESSNGRLVQLGLSILNNSGAVAEFWNLTEKPLPLVGADGSWDDPIVSEFQEMASNADAYLISSPEYHGTMSGVICWIFG